MEKFNLCSAGNFPCEITNLTVLRQMQEAIRHDRERKEILRRSGLPQEPIILKIKKHKSYTTIAARKEAEEARKKDKRELLGLPAVP